MAISKFGSPVLQQRDQLVLPQQLQEEKKLQPMLHKKDNNLNLGLAIGNAQFHKPKKIKIFRSPPIVEKKDLSPHSATKTSAKVLITVFAADNMPAPFPEKSETASSAWLKIQDIT